MASKTRNVGFRIRSTVYEKLTACAKTLGQSPGGFAREAMLEKLARQESEASRAPELEEQVKTLRHELALATEAILTVIGCPLTPEQATVWVRKNLNR